MTPEVVFEIGIGALHVVVLLTAPLLLSALVVGLFVGMIQAATSINEMTLSFIPKLIVLVIALSISGRWMLTILIEFTRSTILNIPNVIGIV